MLGNGNIPVRESPEGQRKGDGKREREREREREGWRDGRLWGSNTM